MKHQNKTYVNIIIIFSNVVPLPSNDKKKVQTSLFKIKCPSMSNYSQNMVSDTQYH